MSEKMLVTQALDERDLLVKKIADKIDKASFVDTIKPNEDNVYAKRIGKDEYAREAQSASNISGWTVLGFVLTVKEKLSLILFLNGFGWSENFFVDIEMCWNPWKKLKC